jgi:hypothetical protein
MKTLPVLAASVALAACAAPLPTVTSGPDAADPAAPVRAATYAPVTAGNTDYRPVDPASWRDMNEKVSPSGARGMP